LPIYEVYFTGLLNSDCLLNISEQILNPIERIYQ